MIFKQNMPHENIWELEDMQKWLHTNKQTIHEPSTNTCIIRHYYDIFSANKTYVSMKTHREKRASLFISLQRLEKWNENAEHANYHIKFTCFKDHPFILTCVFLQPLSLNICIVSP